MVVNSGTSVGDSFLLSDKRYWRELGEIVWIWGDGDGLVGREGWREGGKKGEEPFME